jgi:hypothetical protein
MRMGSVKTNPSGTAGLRQIHERGKDTAFSVKRVGSVEMPANTVVLRAIAGQLASGMEQNGDMAADEKLRRLGRSDFMAL